MASAAPAAAVRFAAPAAAGPGEGRRSPPPRRLSLRNVGSRPSRALVRCSSGGTNGSPLGDNESKDILDAFFLGRAFVETLNERVESTVGEVISVVSQWQAEQQKQVQEFQDEVMERAKKAKEKAAREAVVDGAPKPLANPAADVQPPISFL